MPEIFILVPGRTSKQGVGINEGKFESTYQKEIHTLLMSPVDMERLEIESGDIVQLTSDFGQISINVEPAKKDDLPEGLLFMAYGDLSSQLIGGDTHSSGMPTSKGIDVEVKVIERKSAES